MMRRETTRCARRALPGLFALFSLGACATSPETVARLGAAKSPADFSAVPDYDLCSRSVPATPAVLAERKVRRLGDCSDYFKAYEDMYNPAEVVRGGWFGLALSPIIVGMAMRDRKIISSASCPFNPDVINGAGAWTYQRKPGCPRYVGD